MNEDAQTPVVASLFWCSIGLRVYTSPRVQKSNTAVKVKSIRTRERAGHLEMDAIRRPGLREPSHASHSPVTRVCREAVFAIHFLCIPCQRGEMRQKIYIFGFTNCIISGALHIPRYTLTILNCCRAWRLFHHARERSLGNTPSIHTYNFTGTKDLLR